MGLESTNISYALHTCVSQLEHAIDNMLIPATTAVTASLHWKCIHSRLFKSHGPSTTQIPEEKNIKKSLSVKKKRRGESKMFRVLNSERKLFTKERDRHPSVGSTTSVFSSMSHFLKRHRSTLCSPFTLYFQIKSGLLQCFPFPPFLNILQASFYYSSL